jgi:two-component sensor histidine kinase
VTELVTNAFKHAFPTGRGEVRIKLARPSPDEAMLAVIDNGVGLPEGFELGQAASLGLKLVQRLAEQIKGWLVLGDGPGTSFFLHFKPLTDSEET